MMEDFFFTEEEKQYKFYKVVDKFLDDPKKISLLVEIVASVCATLSSFKWFRDIISSKERLIKFSVPNHKLIVIFSEIDGISQISARPKQGFLLEWKTLLMPEDFNHLLKSATNKKDVKKTISRLLKIKAFW